jgi:hypothetical protein
MTEELVRELTEGAFDLHVHSSPSIFPRSVSDLQLAHEARAAGMGGLVIKAHEGSTVERAQLVGEAVSGIAVFGSLVLNHFVGGFNPFAVELAAKMGARLIWMPTIAARNHLHFYGSASYKSQKAQFGLRALGEGLSIFGEDGKILPEVEEILRIAAENDVAVCTGHLSPAEVVALVRAARSARVQKIVVTHPDLDATAIPLEVQRELAAEGGAYVEKTLLVLMPGWKSTTPEALAASVKALGADHCIMSTDFGQANNPSPVEGLRTFIRMMLAAGLSRAEIGRMVRDNPRSLVG